MFESPPKVTAAPDTKWGNDVRRPWRGARRVGPLARGGARRGVVGGAGVGARRRICQGGVGRGGPGRRAQCVAERAARADRFGARAVMMSLFMCNF